MRSSSLCASCASPLTRSRKLRRPISSTSSSEAARTVALRGRSSSTPISPRNSPSLAVPSRMQSSPTSRSTSAWPERTSTT